MSGFTSQIPCTWSACRGHRAAYSFRVGKKESCLRLMTPSVLLAIECPQSFLPPGLDENNLTVHLKRGMSGREPGSFYVGQEPASGYCENENKFLSPVKVENFLFSLGGYLFIYYERLPREVRKSKSVWGSGNIFTYRKLSPTEVS